MKITVDIPDNIVALILRAYPTNDTLPQVLKRFLDSIYKNEIAKDALVDDTKIIVMEN